MRLRITVEQKTIQKSDQAEVIVDKLKTSSVRITLICTCFIHLSSLVELSSLWCMNVHRLFYFDLFFSHNEHGTKLLYTHNNCTVHDIWLYSIIFRAPDCAFFSNSSYQAFIRFVIILRLWICFCFFSCRLSTRVSIVWLRCIVFTIHFSYFQRLNCGLVLKCLSFLMNPTYMYNTRI